MEEESKSHFRQEKKCVSSGSSDWNQQWMFRGRVKNSVKRETQAGS